MSIVSRIALALLALLAIAAVVVVSVVTFIDPNRFRAPITELVHDQTGLWVQIEGNLAWSLRPIPRIEAQKLSADWASDAAAPFASVERLSFGLAILPLLSTEPRLAITDVDLEGLALHLVRDRAGRANWQRQAVGGGSDEAGGDSSAALGFDRLAVNDAVVTYEDLGAGQTLKMNDLDIEAEDVNLGTPFDIEMHTDFELVNQATHIVMDIAAQVTVNAALTRVGLDDFKTSGELVRAGEAPIPYELTGRMANDAEAGTARLLIERFEFGEALLQLDADAFDLLAVPKLEGHIDVDVPDSRALFEALGLETIPLEHVALAMDFTTRGQAVTAKAIRLRLDDSTLTGELALSDAVVPELTFDLHADVISLDPYLASASSEPASAISSTTQPIDPRWFEGMHWNGKLAAGRVSAAGLSLANTALTTRQRNGLATGSVRVGALLGGKASADLELDARNIRDGTENTASHGQATPNLSARIDLTGIDAARLSTWIGGDARMQGNIDGDGELKASADNIEKTLAGKVRLRSANANLSFDANELDDAHIEGELIVQNGTVRGLGFELRSDLLKLAPLVNSQSATTDYATTAHAPLFDPTMLDALQWNGRANIERIEAGELHLNETQITTSNRDRLVNADIKVGSVLGGRLAATAHLDARGEPSWKSEFQVNQMDAKSLMDWLGYTADLNGRMEMSGELTARGNTRAALGESVRGSLGFASQGGTVNIEAIKEIALTLALLAKSPQTVASWPDVVQYKRLTGSLGLTGLDDQRLDFALDNLVVEGNGMYDMIANTVDYEVQIAFRNLPRYYTFDVPQRFLDVAFPVRCEGPIGSERLCRLSKDAAAKIIAQLAVKEAQRQLFKALEKALTPKTDAPARSP
jgi:uncharacterized protein involved in outer membrane biogenesis